MEHPTQQPQDNDAEPPRAEPHAERVIAMSRREFWLATAAGTLGYLAASWKLREPAEPERKWQLLDETVERARLQNLWREATSSRASHLRTLGESTALSILQMLAADRLDTLPLETGGRALTPEQADEEERASPVGHFVLRNLLNPVTEEAIFRLIPSAVFSDKRKGVDWANGALSTAAFGLVHNLGRDERGFLFHYASLPILQSTLGAYCWYMTETRGFSHAVTAHVAYNVICDRYARWQARQETSAPSAAPAPETEARPHTAQPLPHDENTIQPK